MKVNKRDSRSLSHKEKKFVENVISGMNGTQAALAAYETDSTNTAAVIACRNIRKAKIINIINTNLSYYGLLDLAFQRLSEALNANKSETSISSVPDHNIRLKASDRTIKLLLIAHNL